jgi:hypothetical protein
MGVHSLDQIVYGSTLGVWSAITMHFIVRDGFIGHIQCLIDGENSDTMRLRKYLGITSVFYVFYELLSITTFLIVNAILSPDSPTLIQYKSNYEAGGCGILDMTYAL